MKLLIDIPLEALKIYYIDENHSQKECCEHFHISQNALQRRINLYGLKKDCKEIVAKRKKTCVQKYGVDSPAKVEEFKEKQKNTMIERYGVLGTLGLLEVRNKIKENNVVKYGVDHPMKSETGQQNFQNTMLERYGVTNPSQDSIVKQKKIKTCVKNLGVENPSQSEEIKKKKEDTNMEHFGVKCNLTLESTKEQIRKTCMEKYGTLCPPISKYKIDGINFDSSWEAALYIYARDHNEQIQRSPVHIPYEYNGKQHYTIPDFLYKGELIEIKGDQFFKDGSLINIYDRGSDGQSSAKYQAALQFGVKFWFEKDIQFAINYVKQQYSSDFLEQYKR